MQATRTQESQESQPHFYRVSLFWVLKQNMQQFYRATIAQEESASSSDMLSAC